MISGPYLKKRRSGDFERDFPDMKVTLGTRNEFARVFKTRKFTQIYPFIFLLIVGRVKDERKFL